MIKAQVIGHLGRDAVLSNVNARQVINFTVAHTESYNNAQGVKTDKTIWVNCAYWTDRVAIAPYLKKGTQVYVEGQPDVQTYTTQDGRTGASLTLRVQSIQLLGSKNNEGGDTQPTQQPYNSSAAAQPRPASTPSYSSQPAANVSNSNDITEPLDDLPF